MLQRRSRESRESEMGMSEDIAEMKTGLFWRAVCAEFLGTLLLVLIACGSCWKGEIVVAISISFGLTVGIVVWCIAHVSGGHINPAVTLSFLVTRRISIFRTIFYIIAQCAGAVAGASLLRALTPKGSNDGLCAPAPAFELSFVKACSFELSVTFLLVFTVFATCDGRRNGFGLGPLAIGLSITCGHLWAVSTTVQLALTHLCPSMASFPF